MSKTIKQKRKQSKNLLYKGWPISRLRCFTQYNKAIFYMEDPLHDHFSGFTVAVNSKKWSENELENTEALFDYQLYELPDDNHSLSLGSPATSIPSIEQLKDADIWINRKEYLEFKRIYKKSPWRKSNEENY